MAKRRRADKRKGETVDNVENELRRAKAEPPKVLEKSEATADWGKSVHGHSF